MASTRQTINAGRDDGDDDIRADASISWLTALPNEILTLVLSHCGPRDLCHMSMVARFARAAAFDDRLWEVHYRRAVSECSPDCVCLAQMAEPFIDVALTTVAKTAIERLLDPENHAPLEKEALVPRRVRQLCKEWPHDACPHHWPSVAAARGYRWAFAAASVRRPRWFGPHQDGSPGNLVGCVKRRDVYRSRYRGDLVSSRGKCVPHGYGTSNEIHYACQCGSVAKAFGVSGKWAHALPTGPVVGWLPLSSKTYAAKAYDCPCSGWQSPRGRTLFFQGGFGSHGINGPCVFIGKRMIRAAEFHQGRPTHMIACNRIGSTWVCWDSGLDRRAAGTVRTSAGLGFVGNIERLPRGAVPPLSNPYKLGDGCYFALAGGRPLFRGDFAMGRGRIYPSDENDSPVLESEHWNFAWRRSSRVGADIPAELVLARYPNGDVATWAYRGQKPTLERFVINDSVAAESCNAPLGWCVITLPDLDAPAHDAQYTCGTRTLLLQATAAMWLEPCPEQILNPHEVVDPNTIFWPRIGQGQSADDAVTFVDAMAARQRTQKWRRARAMVRAFYGLGGVDQYATERRPFENDKE